jgi:hypothetical protein
MLDQMINSNNSALFRFARIMCIVGKHNISRDQDSLRSGNPTFDGNGFRAVKWLLQEDHNNPNLIKMVWL